MVKLNSFLMMIFFFFGILSLIQSYYGLVKLDFFEDSCENLMQGTIVDMSCIPGCNETHSVYKFYKKSPKCNEKTKEITVATYKNDECPGGKAESMMKCNFTIPNDFAVFAYFLDETCQNQNNDKSMHFVVTGELCIKGGTQYKKESEDSVTEFYYSDSSCLKLKQKTTYLLKNCTPTAFGGFYKFMGFGY